MKYVTKNFIGKKEELTNKGNDKPEDADSFLHDATSHALCLYKINKILGEVVSEKSLTKKCYWRKRKMDIQRMLSLSYTIQVVVPNVCTKFQNPWFSSS